jgi:hypothetical protein
MNWKRLESGLGIIELLFRPVPGSTEEENEKPQS